ncbi:glycosyltransferase family 4 protein [Microvirga sp. CF3016]|uniref:glycosyltransferase family 4 protein n=1 Tax=Microvirga sp. CF3016 TaxID=3110181 RepID=UPI002E79A1F4|nr:glycosyltransferase family 4 protein [Microvirga sp. CF3016]MEE1612620.1 glycosyltransferase family 4 protein [Microvirga sp. CF3016]
MAWPDEKTGLHVLMTADAVGGVWQYALDLSEGLRPHGVKTTIAVLGPPPSADQRAMAEAAAATLILTGLPLDWAAPSPHEAEGTGRAITRIAAHIRPDVVHLNTPALAASAAFDVPVVAVCHSCVATWWHAVKTGPLPEEFVWRTELVKRGYDSAARLLAPTHAFAQATAQAYKLLQTPIVVRNGRRAMPVTGQRQPNEFVFAAGRLWDEGKNVAVIDRVASRLTIPILAAGPLEGPNGTKVMVAHARALGRLSDAEIAQYLGAQPIFISMARYEPFGLAVLEAAQTECALVLSDIPTFRELWEDAALFVDPSDEDAIAKAIEHLLDHPKARADLGRAARKRADAYTVEAMCAGVLNAYRSVLCQNPLRPPVEGATA